MANDLATLYEVQQFDTRIREREREREALESGAELSAQVGVLRMQAHNARDELRAIENELRDTELQIKTREAKKREFEEKMYSGRVRNPKELDDMQREVEMLGHQVDKLEDRGLDLMEQSEQRRGALGEQEAELSDSEGRLREIEKRYREETARIESEIEQLQAQRQRLVPGVPPDLLRRYDDLRAKRDNLAIVRMTSEVCPGCRIGVSIDTMRQLKRGARVSCESCGRLLYWEAAEPAPPAAGGAPGQ